MGSYYYLMAQLPYLIYEQKPPMSSIEFKDTAKRLMAPADAAVFETLSLNYTGSSTCDFVRKWQEWDKNLRLNLAKQRIIKSKFEKSFTEPQLTHLDTVAAASKAVDEHSPLEAEFLLDKARWHAIEEIAGDDYFHKNSAYAYYLKLLLMERRQSFDTDKGFTEYKSLYASIVESAQNTGESI